MAYHVIYVPGLGDYHSRGQDVALKGLRIFGFRTHYLALGWRNKESFGVKVKRLIDKIDRLTKQGHKVSLIGTSAGASAVIAAYALRPHVNGVVTIAGKIHNPETIKQMTRDENPDFYEGATLIRDNLLSISERNDLENILCIYAQGDKTVPPEDAIIDQGSEYRTPGWNHVSGIFFGAIFGAPTITRFLKSRR